MDRNQGMMSSQQVRVNRQMAKIIRLDEYRETAALRAGPDQWSQWLRNNVSARTGLGELSPATLLRLSEAGEGSAGALYALILRFLGYGPSTRFDTLDSKTQSDVLDIHLFMADQIRFEMMHRLGWLDRFSGTQFSLFEMVSRFPDVRQVCQVQPPQLAHDHPRWSEYRLLVDRDQQVFIRRMLTSALTVFKTRYHL
jgi:hypothetical protein